jgi:hypothetical protein
MRQKAKKERRQACIDINLDVFLVDLAAIILLTETHII